jgi:Down syndrome cell adhesion protein
MHVLENGSLVIRAVEILDEGRYVCEATNGVGKPVETSAELLVYESPVIRASHTQVLVKKRDRAELSCVASGSPHLIFSWMKNDHLLVKDSRGVIITNGNTGISSTHISIHEEDSHNRKEKITILIIHSVTRNDSAVYSCSANNNYGNDRGNIRLIVQESPDPPNDLRFLEVSSRSVSLSWIVAFNGNSPVTGYEVVHKEANGK